MSSQPTTTANDAPKQAPPLPKPGKPDPGRADALKTFMDGKIPYASIARIERTSEWSHASKYRENRLWLQPAFGRDANRTPHWSDIEFGGDDDDAVPTPCQPEIFVHLSNEEARLGKPEFKPYVRPQGENPDSEDRKGAKLAERALQDRLEAMDWEEIEAEGDMHMPLWGQSIYKSWFEMDSTKLTRIPLTTAKACPRHPMAMGKDQPPAGQPDETQDSAPAGSNDTEYTDETALDGTSVAERTEGSSPSGVMRAENLSPSSAVPSMDSTVSDPTLAPPLDPTQPSVPPPVAPPAPPQECGFVTASADLPANLAQRVPRDVITGKSIPHPNPSYPGEMGIGFDVTSCPTCEDHPPLVDFYPSDKEAATGKDHFGRPLGEDKSLGDWMISNVIPHDLMPQSFGIGLTKASQWQYFVHVYPMPVAWIATHWDNGKFVKPENASAIMEWHPVGGDGCASGVETGGGVFEDFARVKEYHEKPSPTFPLGRSIVMAGNQVLLDSTFMVESQAVPGEHYERVHLELIPWAPKPHETWGLSMSELLRSLQDSISEARSMDEDVESRMGIMYWLAKRGMDLDTVALEAGGYNGKVVEYGGDPMDPSARPEAIGGEHQTGNMVERVKFFVDAMGRIAGTNDVEGGEPPPGGNFSAVALQFLAEKSGERRTTRLRRKRKALERLYSHGLKLMYHRCLEPRKLTYKDADGRYKEEAWTGLQFNGQITAQIRAESEHNTKLQEQQKITDLMKIPGFYDLQNPSVRDSLSDKLEAPRDLVGQLETQRSSANREWCEFRDDDTEPMVDESIDDPNTHHDQHGLDIQSEEFRDLEEQAQWKTIAPWLSDFWTQFPVLEQQLAAAGVVRDPLLEHRIMAAEDLLLSQRKVNTTQLPPDQLKALRKVMRFRAHYESHKKGAEFAAQAAAAGAAQLAAPGAAETQGGVTPGPGAPAVPQPGTMSPPAPAPQPAMVQ